MSVSLLRFTQPAGAALIALFLAACLQSGGGPQQPIAGADVARGREAIAAYGCAACHVIPGISWPRGAVGPSLEGFGARSMIAGRVGNEPAALIAFVRNAPSVAPGTAMPPIPLTEGEARDVAAYLYTLDAR